MENNEELIGAIE